MGIDADGFIETLDNAPIQGAFSPVLENACIRLGDDATPLVHSVYVYGSVATGLAVPGRSDLDLSLILNRTPSSSEKAVLEKIRLEIEANYPVVTKVDFDIGSLEDIASPDAGMAWRYWLKHHCRCILGVDLAAPILRFKPSRTLALAVNGNFRDVLADYAARIAASNSMALSQRLRREAARKAIRSTNILRGETDGDWPTTLEDHDARFCRLFPEKANDLRFFLDQSRNPSAPAADFIARLDRFAGWMDQAVHVAATTVK